MPPVESAIVLRVQNLEQGHAKIVERVDAWDQQFGRMLSVAGESRDAAVRAADQAVELMGQIRELKIAVETRCDERCGVLKHEVKDIRDSIQQKQSDEFEVSTGLMNRDELINSRQYMKMELANLKEQLEKLNEAEELRAQAERDKQIAEQAVRDAETARLQVQREAEQKQREADERDEVKDALLKKEKIKSLTSIVLAILGIVSAAITAAVSHWG